MSMPQKTCETESLSSAASCDCASRKPVICIVGPTASGKTDFAQELAVALDGEVVSADSMQIYRGMDIGTGKIPCSERKVPHWGFDLVEPGQEYSAALFQEYARNAFCDIAKRGKQPILCGGTGLYIEAVLGGYHLSPVPQNPELRELLADKSLDELTRLLENLKARNHSNMHNTTDVDTAQRAIRAIEIETYNLEHPTDNRAFPKIDSVIVGVDIDRANRREKITARLRQRLAHGMIDEIQALLDSGIPAENLIYYALEYKFVTEYLTGKTTYDEMFNRLEIAIHQFAKRQMTWFRGMERRGYTIHWIDALQPMEQKVEQVMQLLNDNS